MFQLSLVLLLAQLMQKFYLLLTLNPCYGYWLEPLLWLQSLLLLILLASLLVMGYSLLPMFPQLLAILLLLSSLHALAGV
jgi:hypothetical protein